MNITLTWEKENLIDDPVWIATTQRKVDAARAWLDRNGGTDGEVAINQLLKSSVKPASHWYKTIR